MYHPLRNQKDLTPWALIMSNGMFWGLFSILGNAVLTMIVLLRWPPRPKKIRLNKQAVKLALNQLLEANQENVLTTIRA